MIVNRSGWILVNTPVISKRKNAIHTPASRAQPHLTNILRQSRPATEMAGSANMTATASAHMSADCEAFWFPDASAVSSAVVIKPEINASAGLVIRLYT